MAIEGLKQCKSITYLIKTPNREKGKDIETFLFLAICGTIALIIFGALGDGRDFMPDWEQNYLSWSFGLAFVGVFLMYVVSILFIVEARIIQRKETARESQFPMEKRV